MFFDLIVSEFENLKSIWERGLRGPRLSKVVDDSLISIGLLNIVVIEVDNGVSVWEHLSFDSIVEYDFLLSIFVHSLDLSIVSYDLFHDLHVDRCLAVVLHREFHVEFLILLFLICICNC